MSAGYSYVWEFQVDAPQRAEFERQYGPEGSWAQLFRRADGYLGTLLLRDRAQAGRYLTIDRWRDAASLERFRADFASEYACLDAQCEPLTRSERSLGEFDG